jgi:hypothetical protein
MSTPNSPCRLFVYLAGAAPLGVVLRRGPSDWARLSLWHTDTDAFVHGQWVRARVYERRSDLSADGSLFVSFARRSAGPSAEHRDTWVAVSRPPWFTALALWFVGGTYYAGGCFPDGRTLSLGFDPDPPSQGRLPSWLGTTTAWPPDVDRTNDWTERTVWLNRLRRDGWSPVDGAVPEAWQRPAPGGDRTLVMTLRSNLAFGAYGGRHVVEYAVRPEPTGEAVPIGQATWADWDHRGRLVVARDGRLWCWQGPGSLEEIADFNGQVPEPAPAPRWASSWPRRPRRAR